MQSQEYLALSRKYRPMDFDDVNGHEVIITILKNQLSSKKVAHAYLFTGLHGTGKTTLARIFAKSLNCDDKKNLNPCNKCSSCEKITASSSLDVLEIDGASNRGIDDIRNINETVGYATFDGKYKIYIIDEVHMLTKEAFNALLKTLEEPPKNTKFFFATTEAHKIPPTILSRCQKIELKRLPLSKIKEKLTRITKNLSLSVSDDALSIIARFAEGSMRDGESILENVIAYKSDGITTEDIYTILNICPKKVFFEIDSAFKAFDQTMPFKLGEILFASHTNLHSLIDQMCIHFRCHGLSILNQSNEETALFTKEEKDGYKDSTSFYSMDQILEILNMLAGTYHYNHPPISKKIHVEILLQKILSCKHAKSSNEILSHLQNIATSLSMNPGMVNTPPKEQNPTKPFNGGSEKSSTKSFVAPKTAINQSQASFKQTASAKSGQRAPEKTMPSPPVQNEVKVEKKEETQKSSKAPLSSDESLDINKQNHIDTLVQFANVELSGNLTKDPID